MRYKMQKKKGKVEYYRHELKNHLNKNKHKKIQNMNEHGVGVKYNGRIKMGWKKFEL